MKKLRLTRKGLTELPLRPYPGVLFVTKDRKVFERAAKELLDREENLTPSHRGRFVQGPSWYNAHVAVVWYSSPHTLAHELAHVVFGVFDCVGVDPTRGNDEPFCYMLSQLMLEALQK